MFIRFNLEYFVLVLFAVVVLDLVSSVLRREIGWEERLRNDLSLYRFGCKTFTQSINQFNYIVHCLVIKRP